MRTGKAGRYRYYACQKTARTESARCTGIAIPIDALDTLVAQHIMGRLLERKRIEAILMMILKRRQALMARALDLLLARIGRLYANKPAAGSAAAAQLREAIALAVRLADRLQAPAARLPS